MRAKRTAEERFWAKVDKDGPAPEDCPDLGPCWVWTGAISGGSAGGGGGYGLFFGERKGVVAHRWAWEQAHGHKLAPGLLLDHLCRNRSCVNPAHLEPVMPRVNVLRGVGHSARNALKTHCPQGHPYAGDNLYVSRQGRRHCKACMRATDKRRRGPTAPHPRERTHCPEGHPYAGGNLYVQPDGRRACRTCMRARHAARWAARSQGKGLPGQRTHCPQGHPYEGANLYLDPRGRRHCWTCKQERQAAVYANRRATKAARQG